MAEPAVALTDVTFAWPGRGGFSLACPSFTVDLGESVLLLGASGSGKSTFLSLVCGIVAADRGNVVVDGTDLGALRSGARDRFRAERIGVIFQQFNLLPYARVADNILLPLRFAPERRARAGDARDEAARLCAALGLPGDVLATQAGRLSVGQQQRVAVARALIGAPPLIVADEPTSALDAGTQDSFLSLLFGQADKLGSSLLMVSHDERLGGRFDRIIRLEDIVTTERLAT
ncbi:ABC transporter ATP-binding protein [Paracoccus seriniphilus]|uniref:Putative ABC transport system ATP-binding protein n=1 Tax=Paracoccus seriniphilus TaxID=184748 RepID=A0A239PQX0_9RHOB|nr:ATP-binding cassette domain-containing protein [Paracoccus seriniphilus]WCR12896.1 ATP-binding cassette domain-containing protein [Paracoccus seriniphilus]SNT72675.1 putative ABC transport system ATP-binding protein [Paracoccus seriniphilus]